MGDIINIGSFLYNWGVEQFEESGITDRVDKAGMLLTLGPPRGIRINYFDINGDIVPNYFRVRVHPEDFNEKRDDFKYGEEKFHKYWQPKGLYQRLYWPRVEGVDHRSNIGDVSCPIFLVEGEKKALALQSKLIALGIKGSAIGLPGVRIGKDLIKELQAIPWSVSVKNKEVSRPTWLVFDWNDSEKPEADTRKGESILVSTLSPLHASLRALRWPLPKNDHGNTLDAGVQKVDDWLVAGGDLPDALAASEEADFVGGNELMQLMLMFNEHWGMYKGVYVMIDGPNKGSILTRTQFMDETAEYFVLDTTGKKPKKVPVSKEWMEWPGKRRIEGFTVFPPPYGEPLQEWVDGKLNMCQSWVPVEEPPPWMDAPPTHLIDTLLRNFCEGEEHFIWLRQHIAFMLLHPEIPTSQAVLMCGKPGTGKTLLMDSFRRLAHKEMLGGLAKSIRLDRKDDFNKEMEGTVIGIFEEPMKGAQGKDVESVVKRTVGVKVLDIRAMRQDSYQAPNVLHLFVAMNLRYLAHLGKDDRRCNFFEGKEKIGLDGNGFGKTYDEFLISEEFHMTWLAWVRSVDLTGYSPQVLGPCSKARTIAIGLSSTTEDDFFTCEEFESCEAFTPSQMMWLWDKYNKNKEINEKKLGALLTAGGWYSKLYSIKGEKLRFWVANEEWLSRSGKEIADENEKATAPKGPKY